MIMWTINWLKMCRNCKICW